MFEELENVSIANLKKICKQEEIHGYSKLKKQDVIDLIKKHRIVIMVKEGLDELNAL